MKEMNPSSGARAGGKVPHCRVTYAIEEEVRKGFSLHFNATGLLVICAEPAPLKTRLKLSLHFTGLRNAIEAEGEVVWTNIHGSADNLSPRGMGVKFLNLERDTERILSELAARFETQGNMYECYYT